MNTIFQTPTRILLFLLLFFANKSNAQTPCVDSSQINLNAVCPLIYDPVCGCNGVTYGNWCEAYFWGGVTSWAPGVCGGNVGCNTLNVNFNWSTSPNSFYKIDFLDLSSISGGQIISWAWTFGDNQTSNQQNPSHTYASSGTYNVCLTVQAFDDSSQVCQKTFCQAFTLEQIGCPDKCPYQIEYDLDGTALHATLTPPVDTPPFFFFVLWSLDGGAWTNNGLDFVHLFQGTGRHVLCATYPTGDFAPINCTVCTAFEVKSLCVNPAQIDSTVPCPLAFIPVCGCDGVTYDNACSAYNYGGVTSWKPGICGSVCNDLFVDFEGFNSDGSLTVWTFNDLSVFGNGGQVTSWYWDFGNGTTSFEQNPTINFLDNGDYVVCLTVSGTADNGTQCGASVCDTIHVGSQLCIDPSVIDTTVFCPAVYDPVCGCDGVTYPNSCIAQNYYGVTSWTSGICPSDCLNPAWIDTLAPCIEIYDPVCGCDEVTYDNECFALTHGITAWAKGECCPNPECRAFFKMTLLPNRTVLLVDSSFNAESWHVTFGDGGMHNGGFDSLYHTYPAPGIYQICLEISNFAGSCTSKYCVLADFSGSATGEPSSQIEMTAVPNPARDWAVVRLAGATPSRALLFDIFGKIVLEKNVAAPEFELSLTELPAGIYLLNVETDKGLVAQKIVVSK